MMGFRKGSTPKSPSENDAEYSSYVLRLRESESLQSRHYIKATDLALNAFMLITTGRMMADESDKLASFVLAADSLSDAYFMDERATSSAMKHVGFQHGGGYSMSNIIQPFLQPMLEATFGDSGKEVQARKTRSQATSLCIGC